MACRVDYMIVDSVDHLFGSVPGRPPRNKINPVYCTYMSTCYLFECKESKCMELSL